MDYVDVKYISVISAKLQKFKKIKNNLYNFRCPFCGDSKKNKNKARGYFYQIKNNTNYKCHNCGVNISFNNFLKEIDINIHREWTFEKFKNNVSGKNFSSEEPKFNFEKPNFKSKINLPKASEVLIAKEYLEKRKINPEKFYFADKFKEWANTQKQTFDNTNYEESRIIIPLYDTENKLIGFQGRALGPSPNKYITIMLSDESPKIYGLDKVDSSQPIYIVEGPFDSTFIKNSVAMCGSDIDIGAFNWSDYIWVFDNEPRNREIVNRISKTIDRNEKIVIWPSNIIEKDINELILGGMSESEIMEIIKNNTYNGLEAKLKFINWKKYD